MSSSYGAIDNSSEDTSSLDDGGTNKAIQSAVSQTKNKRKENPTSWGFGLY